eukprot:TRINITY_DN4127_c0_g1_i3.p1 TRINITY_DN4127_c0_g1~~TRINITY_DN4127_c0_g1_i3.p1  ORF type:complete len:272 (-),score=69.74 TRINITY_DN4127_c0_g1_i3:33-743(-)
MCIRDSQHTANQAYSSDTPEAATLKDDEPQEEEDKIDEERSYIFEERLARGGELRAEGNQKFSAGEFEEALALYKRALHHAEFEEMSYNFELQDEHRALVDKEVHPIKLNMAAVYLRIDKIPEVVLCCDYVLKQDPKNCKALYRRAKANVDRGWYEEARTDLNQCMELDSSDKPVKALLKELNKLGKQDRAREQELWNRSLGAKKVETKENSAEAEAPDSGHEPSTMTATSWCSVL